MFIAGLFLISCNNEGSENPLQGTEVQYHTICGWCTGMSQLNITGSDAELVSFDGCTASDSQKQTLDSSILDQLEELLSEVDEQTIDLNQCGECYDGCEEQLIFTYEDGTEHKIVFDNRDYQEVDQLEDLLELLEEVEDSF